LPVGSSVAVDAKPHTVSNKTSAVIRMQAQYARSL
jgi:hypothetical protein